MHMHLGPLYNALYLNILHLPVFLTLCFLILLFLVWISVASAIHKVIWLYQIINNAIKFIKNNNLSARDTYKYLILLKE